MENYRDPAWLRRKYVEERLSQRAIAVLCGVNYVTIGNWMRRFNIEPRSVSEACAGLKHSPETIEKMRRAHKGLICSPETIERIRCANMMENHPNWKGGQYTSNGYVFVKHPNHPHTTTQGYVRRAHLVMEEQLGRFLDPQEVVHHINGDTMDDRPENLMLFPGRASHTAYHRAN